MGIVRLPEGAGLLAPYNYTIEVELVNPAFDPNANDTVDATWQIITRVSNADIYREVDANRSFEPYDYYLQLSFSYLTESGERTHCVFQSGNVVVNNLILNSSLFVLSLPASSSPEINMLH